MKFKILSGIVAFALFVAYFGPILVKLKDVPLGIVLLGGIGLVAVDLWESFRT